LPTAAAAPAAYAPPATYAPAAAPVGAAAPGSNGWQPQRGIAGRWERRGDVLVIYGA
jgi:hypothetical protein